MEDNEVWYVLGMVGIAVVAFTGVILVSAKPSSSGTPTPALTQQAVIMTGTATPAQSDLYTATHTLAATASSTATATIKSPSPTPTPKRPIAVEELLDSPEQYDGQQVCVEGKIGFPEFGVSDNRPHLSVPLVGDADVALLAYAPYMNAQQHELYRDQGTELTSLLRTTYFAGKPYAAVEGIFRKNTTHGTDCPKLEIQLVQVLGYQFDLYNHKEKYTTDQLCRPKRVE